MTLKPPPLAISGLILGLFGSANLLFPYQAVLSQLFYLLALVLWLYLSLSILFCWKRYKDQWFKAPVLSAFATYPMASMLLASYLAKLSPWWLPVSQVLWYLALLLHVFLILTFSWLQIIKSSKPFLSPSWTVLYVGLSMTALTNGVVNQPLLGYLSLIFGFLASLILYPLLYIGLKKTPLPDTLRPQYAIYCAPFSLLLAGYIRLAASQTSISIIVPCLLLSQAFYLLVLYLLPSILKLGLQASSASLTFPLVNTAFALSLALRNLGWKQLFWLAHLEAILALAILLSVLIFYSRTLLASLSYSSEFLSN